jgi:hypothetical protein
MRRLLIAAVLLVTGLGVTTPAVSAGTHVLPTKDPFYRYSGSVPLARVAPGTVLRERSVDLALPQLKTPLPAEQLLYRTRDEQGHPSVEATTVVDPLHGLVGSRILAYLSFYDARTPVGLRPRQVRLGIRAQGLRPGTPRVHRLVPGHPTAPLFMAVGNADGTGDGVMIARDVEALAHDYCRQGDRVEVNVYKGATHTEAALHFETPAVTFLLERFAGLPMTGNCATIPRGNSLAPLQ